MNLLKNLKIYKLNNMFDDKEYYLLKKRGIILIEGKDRFRLIQE